jgi:hypothetical protein
MADLYYRNFNEISLDEYAKELEQAELLPSRKMLQEDLSAKFSCLHENGIQTVGELLTALKTPEKIMELAAQTQLPDMYLAVLNREIKSCLPQPVKFNEIPDISPEDVKKLASVGVVHTRQLFSQVVTANDRQKLSEKTGFPFEKVLELTHLSDVARIRWVGAIFARLLVESTFDTVEKLSNADHSKLYSEILQINEEKKYFVGKLGLIDMKLTVLAARTVPLVIEY